MEPYLTITEVAKHTGLSAHTLRYYERIGLISSVARATGGQRRYAAADMDWLDFLLRLRETGMPIQRMLAFASLRSEGNATAGARREMLEAHRATVLAQVRALQQSEKVLRAKIAHYRQIEQTLSQENPLVEGVTHDRKSL